MVVDHDTARVVWVADGRSAAALREFYDALGPERCALLEAVSMDLGPIYWRATQEAAPQAVICLDPFHVMQLVHRALDRVFADATSGPDRLPLSGRAHARARMLLRTGVEQLTPAEQAAITAYRRSRSKLFRAWELKEAIRAIYQLSGPTARIHLTAWITAATRSRIPAFVNLAHTIRHNFDGIIAAIELGVTNSRVEGLNARIRLIHRRGYGYHTAAAMAALIYLCCSKLPIALPTTT